MLFFSSARTASSFKATWVSETRMRRAARARIHTRRLKTCFYGQKTHFERPNKTLIFNIPSISVIFFAAENGWTWRGGQNSLLAGPQYSCIHSSTFSSGGNILILEIPAFSYFNFVHFQPDLLKNAPNVNYKKKNFIYIYSAWTQERLWDPLRSSSPFQNILLHITQIKPHHHYHH